jgi:hypothetical protein
MKNFAVDAFYGTKDHRAFCDSIQKALNELPEGGIFVGDNIFTFGRNLSFLEDPDFMRAFDAHTDTNSEKAVIWRAHVLGWAAKRALRLEGDLVECGCYKGVTARIVADYIGLASTGRRFFLYDLFEHEEGAKHHAMPEHSAELYDAVCRRFADMPSVRVIKGAVPASFAQGVPERIAFLHIDMNNAEAELGALEALYDRIVPGAVVVFDDYGWLAYRGQKLAEDRFVAARGNQILELPTGQGLLIV